MTNNTATLVDTLRDKTTLELLHMRAEGDMLADEWHWAIEHVLAARGVAIPPLPSAPIVVARTKDSTNMQPVLALGAFLLLTVAGNMLAHTLAGFVLGAAVVLWYGFQSVYHSGARAAAAQQRKLANDEGLNELMRCAADGQIARVNELLAYRAVDVNARTRSGATALFYAARNGHADIAEVLVKAGADRNVKNDKGLRAVDIAKRYGHARLVALL